MLIGLAVFLEQNAVHPIPALQIWAPRQIPAATVAGIDSWMIGLAEAFGGAAIGLILGVAVWTAFSGQQNKEGKTAWHGAAQLALVGMFLGWQAAAFASSCGIAFGVICVCFARKENNSQRPIRWASLGVMVAAMIWVMNWRHLVTWQSEHAKQFDYVGLALFVVAVVSIAFARVIIRFIKKQSLTSSKQQQAQ